MNVTCSSSNEKSLVFVDVQSLGHRKFPSITKWRAFRDEQWPFTALEHSDAMSFLIVLARLGKIHSRTRSSIFLSFVSDNCFNIELEHMSRLRDDPSSRSREGAIIVLIATDVFEWKKNELWTNVLNSSFFITIIDDTSCSVAATSSSNSSSGTTTDDSQWARQ